MLLSILTIGEVAKSLVHDLGRLLILSSFRSALGLAPLFEAIQMVPLDWHGLQHMTGFLLHWYIIFSISQSYRDNFCGHVSPSYRRNPLEPPPPPRGLQEN